MRIPLGHSTAFQLNPFSALVGVTMLGMLAAVVRLTDRLAVHGFAGEIAVGWVETAALGGSLLALGLSCTIWRYSITFSPCRLTGLRTAALLWVMLCSWQEASHTVAVG